MKNARFFSTVSAVVLLMIDNNMEEPLERPKPLSSAVLAARLARLNLVVVTFFR